MTLDARGYSCPEPVVMLKKALKTANELVVLLDNKASAENCEGFALKQGYKAAVAERDGEFALSLKKS